MFTRTRSLSRREMLASSPCLNPKVRITELDTGGIMMVYEKAGSMVTRGLRQLFAIPRTSELLLDEIGSRIVRQIDGTKRVSDLILYVAQEYNLSRKEAEVALLTYLDRLGRRNLVGFNVHANVEGTGKYDE